MGWATFSSAVACSSPRSSGFRPRASTSIDSARLVLSPWTTRAGSTWAAPNAVQILYDVDGRNLGLVCLDDSITAMVFNDENELVTIGENDQVVRYVIDLH